MKYHKQIMSLFSAITLLFASCSDDATPANVLEPNKGSVILESIELSVDKTEEVITRSDIELSNYTIQLCSSSGIVVYQGLYSQLPEKIEVVTGEYIIKAFNSVEQKAGWDAPYYFGSKAISVEANDQTNVGELKCKMANIKTEIRLSDELKCKIDSDWHVTVYANNEGNLTYTANETRLGYFAVIDGSTSLVAELTATINNEQYVYRHLITDIAAGQHRIITFCYTNPNPGKEDPIIATEKITITSDNVAFETPIPVQDNVSVQITSEDGIGSLDLSISTTNEYLSNAFAEAGMPMVFNLANPGDMEDAYREMSLPTGADITGAKNIELNLCGLMPLFDLFDGTHTLTIAATDINGNNLTKNVIFTKNL